MKKLMTQSQENARMDGKMEGETEGQKDGQTLFHGTLLATAGGPITYRL